MFINSKFSAPNMVAGVNGPNAASRATRESRLGSDIASVSDHPRITMVKSGHAEDADRFRNASVILAYFVKVKAYISFGLISKFIFLFLFLRKRASNTVHLFLFFPCSFAIQE